MSAAKCTYEQSHRATGVFRCAHTPCKRVKRSKEREMNSRILYSLAGFAIALSSLITSARAQDLEPIQVGQPQRLEVFPAAVKLNGPRRQAQIVVTGVYADGTLQDLTRAAEYPPSDQKVFRLEG